MLRVQSYHGVWRMSVGWRELKGEALEDGAQRHLGFQQRKALADADPGPPSERKESGLMPGGVGDAIGKPLWIELTCVFSPNVGIMVNEDDGQKKVHSCRIFDSTELHFFISSSG